MFSTTFNLILYQNITPLHMGCGQDVGVVDNPIVRERATGYPFIPGSGIRGVLRSGIEGADTNAVKGNDSDSFQEKFNALFGPEMKPGEHPEHASCLSVLDAKILLFPVRTDKKVFHWITCPFVLKRFNCDVKAFVNNRYKFECTNNLKVGEDKYLGGGFSDMALEEFAFESAENSKKDSEKKEGKKDSRSEKFRPVSEFLSEWAKSLQLNDSDRFLIVSDQAFDYFVRNATIVMQHNRLTSAKTVADGALYSVESVPPEAVFYGFVDGTGARSGLKEISDGKNALAALFKFLQNGGNTGSNETFLQLGADESTGLGVTRMRWLTE